MASTTKRMYNKGIIKTSEDLNIYPIKKKENNNNVDEQPEKESNIRQTENKTINQEESNKQQPITTTQKANEEKITMSENEFDFIEDFSGEEKNQSTLDDNIAGASLNVGFISFGGGGGKLAQSFYKLGYYKNIIVNSTAKDFPKNIDKKNLLELDGPDGLGKDIKLGKQVLKNNSTLIEDALRNKMGKTDLLFVLASGGGGTGSSVGILKDVFTRYMNSTNPDGNIIYIITTPSALEKQNKNILDNSKVLCESLKNETVIVLDNERSIAKLRGSTGISGILPKSNDIFAKLLHQLLKVTAEDSEISACDSQDLLTFFKAKGRILIGSAIIKEPASEDLGSSLYNSCISNSPCEKPQGIAKTAVLLQLLTEDMAENPEISSNLENVQSYVGSRSTTMFSGVYVKEKLPGLIGLLALGGLTMAD